VKGLLASLVVFASALIAMPAFALDEAPGSDHPVVSRFEGSRLIGYRQVDWEEAQFPVSAVTEKGRWRDLTPIEGRMTRLLYTAPRGKSRLEVHRNYQQALVAAGLKTIASCEQKCEYLQQSLEQALGYRTGLIFAKDPLPHPVSGSFMITAAVTNDEVRWFYGTLPVGETELHVLVATSLTVGASMDMATTFIQIVEPRAMLTGQVTVDAKAISKGLKDLGRITLSGLQFDTGKTDIRPESAAQLDAMVAALQAEPKLKVFIVGHTDNVGALAANLNLSEGRAAAVVKALVQKGIAADRLQAKGVANFAPVASNGSEEGRARNRRVEMVAQ
jgi:outer membrane protein OmpA-like peptidoglycan-associated protein